MRFAAVIVRARRASRTTTGASLRRGRFPLYCAVVLALVPALYTALTWDAEPSLLFPALAAVTPLAARSRRQAQALRGIAAAALALWALFALLSVGIFFVPSAAAMTLAWVLSHWNGAHSRS